MKIPSTKIAVTLPLLLGLAAAVGPARADYVATAAEEKAMAARIAKSPPGPAELGGAPDPGALLDMPCSADRSAGNQGRPMIYCYRTRDPEAEVRAHFAGPQAMPAPATTTAPSPAPAAPDPPAEPAPSTATDTVKQATDAVNKLRGLFGR